MDFTDVRINRAHTSLENQDAAQYGREAARVAIRSFAYQTAFARMRENHAGLLVGQPRPTVMPIDKNTGTTALCTPSELVLLSGGRFDSRAQRDNVTLPDGETIVSSQSLGEAILAAAILANDKLGAIRLEVETRKTWLLFSTTRLISSQGNVSITWPAHSLEDFISSKSALQGRGYRESVSDIDYKWLGQYPGDEWISLGARIGIAGTTNFWREAGELVKWGMGQRQLLEMAEERSRLIFTKRCYKLPSRTSILTARESVEAIAELLAEYQRTHREVWRVLIREIHDGVNRHAPEPAD
jgi:hypothetical protein